MPRRYQQKRTVLVVGEGHCDTAFISHVKSIYNIRHSGITVKIRNAKGKGSNNVIDQATGILRTSAFDIVGAFFDTDVPLTKGRKEKARIANIHIIESAPCLEGLLLEILVQYVPPTCGECKAKIAHYLNGNNPTVSEAYSGFTKAVLESRRDAVPELDRLIKLIQGETP